MALLLQCPVCSSSWVSSVCDDQKSITKFLVGPDAERDFMANIYNNPAAQESDDCLNLNVFVPTKTPTNGGFAVMFWIYGGGLQFGSANMPLYDATNFVADQGVIVVAPNYRTNGMYSHPVIDPIS